MLPLQLRRVGLWSSRSDMSKFCVFLMVVGCAFGRPEAAGIIGYGPRCVHEPETIVVKVCHFEPVEACTSEPKVVVHHVTFTKECKEVDVNVCAHGFHHGKRSADAEADPGYIVPKCETVKKEVCRPVPAKEPVEKAGNLHPHQKGGLRRR